MSAYQENEIDKIGDMSTLNPQLSSEAEEQSWLGGHQGLVKRCY